MKRAELIALSYSPWSVKARWALDLRKVSYRYHEYTPMVGEPWLRFKLGAAGLRGRVTIPVLLLAEGAPLTDSLEIARHAQATGRGPDIIPDGLRAPIRDWNTSSELLMVSGRALTTAAVKDSPDALIESVPAALQGPRALTRLVAQSGVAFLTRKYRLSQGDAQQHLDRMRERLDDARAVLSDNPYLIGDQPTYADVAFAAALQFVSPVDARFVPMGPANRRCWTRDSLAKEFGDLIDWRDQLFESLHPRAAKKPMPEAAPTPKDAG